MAKVEDVRALGEGTDDALCLVYKVLPAGDHVARVEVALHATVDLHMRRRPFGRNRIVERHAIGAGGAGKADVAIPRLAREGDDRQAGMAGLQRRDDAGGGLDGEIVEILTPHEPAQLSNSFTTSAPAST